MSDYWKARLLQAVALLVFIPGAVYVLHSAGEIDEMRAKPLHVYHLKDGKFIVMEHGHFRSPVYETREEAEAKQAEIERERGK
jgi:hypothetical protein